MIVQHWRQKVLVEWLSRPGIQASRVTVGNRGPGQPFVAVPFLSPLGTMAVNRNFIGKDRVADAITKMVMLAQVFGQIPPSICPA